MNAYAAIEQLIDTGERFSLISRPSRDLFDVLRDPDGVAELITVNMFEPRGWRRYRTYLYERRSHSGAIIESYATVSAAIAGHSRNCQALWGY
jgi:hypothetical protein